MKKLFTVLAAILVCVTSVFTSCNKDPQSDDTPKKALLIILDGWGIGDQSQSDVIAQTAKTMGYETADVAPTILHIMGLGQPQEMTGQCLINK